MSEADDGRMQTADTMRERSNENRLKLWLLLGANRLALTAVLAVGVFLALLLISTLVSPSLQAEIKSTDTIETIFSATIGVLVTGTTLVVTINQLVLSQETGPLGDQRQRMSDAMDFRTYATQLLGETPAAEPAGFLQELVDTSRQRATDVGDLVGENDDPALREQVEHFTVSLTSNADVVAAELEDAEFGTFDVMAAALDYNYSWKIYQIQRLRDDFEGSLSDAELAAFDDLESALAMFGPAREHVKTLYFQWALVDLSQYILYLAVPALIVAGSMLTFVGAGSFPGATLGVPNVTWVVVGAFTFTLTPFLLFTSYILRIATAAKRTLAVGPLVLRRAGE
ncbi:hypothetical protein ACKVMT_02650 [Halobacteriales archaeon Cl-PHB]